MKNLVWDIKTAYLKLRFFLLYPVAWPIMIWARWNLLEPVLVWMWERGILTDTPTTKIKLEEF